MADPIQSSSPTPPANSSYDPYSDDVGKVSRADVPNTSSAPPAANDVQSEPPAPSASAVRTLVHAVPRPASALPPAASSPYTSAANNNAQRTAEREPRPYAEAGVTASGDSVFAGVALIKGRAPKSSAEAEVLSASVQIGAQTEAQIGFQRVAGTYGPLSGSVETFAARANIGVHNDDGSTGFNAGAGVTAVGFEGSVGDATRFTYGVAAGAGAGVSVGVRDVDGDGVGELCARVSLGPVTVGGCVENPL